MSIKIPNFNAPEKIEAPQPTGPAFKKPVKKKLKPVDYVFRGTLFLVLSSALLVCVYLIYNYSSDFLSGGETPSEQRLVFENELVRADRSRVVSVEAGANKETVRSIIIQALQNERVNRGEISLVMPSYLRDTIVDGKRQLISELQRGDDFFFTFAVRSPLNLRTISAEKYAVGVAGVGDVTQNGSKNFFVFSVSSPPDATREMLRYETQMYYDMKEVLKLRDIKGNFYFKDLSFNNHELRVGYDDNGVAIVYGYGAPKTIIVTPDAETFEMVYQHLK